MALIKTNWRPSDKELRSFGRIAVIATVIIALAFYILKGTAIKWCAVIFAIGLSVFFISLISVKLTKVIYLGLMLVTWPIGFMVSFLIMTAFYFLILTPVGLVFRLTGRDILHIKYDSEAKSYWVERSGSKNLESYFRQF